MKVMQTGEGRPVIGIVTCLHGNEMLGWKAMQDLSFPIGVRLILANEEAIGKNTRFVDEDLNRCFPGSDSTHEGRLAKEILAALDGCDHILDIHSTTARTPAFAICTRPSPLLAWVPLDFAVFMGSFANGRSLLDHVPSGISLEFPKETPLTVVREVVLGLFKNMTQRRSHPKQCFEVFGVHKGGSIGMENFRLWNGFYPVLFGEKKYRGMVCLKAQRRV